MTLTQEDLSAISDLFDERLDKRLYPVEAGLNKVEGRLDKMEGRLDKMEGRLDKMEGRLDRLEPEISELKRGQSEIRGELFRIDRKISDTYNLALDAWGKSTENRTWLQSITK